MTIRALDSNGDWQFGKGKQDYLSGNLEIAENLKTRLLSFLNDCFFATTAGIDWFNLLGQYGTQARIETAVRVTVIQTEGITKINSVDVTLTTTRDLRITYSVDTIYSAQFTGEVIVNGQ